MNQDILEKITNQDYSSIATRIQNGLQQKIKETNSKGVILGLSGGIDSAAITYLCNNIVKEKTLVLIMPDSKISPESETNDAIKIIDTLGMDYKLLDINSIHKEFSMVLEPGDRALGNLRARIRMNILYYYANLKNLIALGSSDKSEFNIGYFTKFGDGAADVLPIVSLYKTQVRELARHLGIDEKIIAKKSSPHLWPNHEAEHEIGVNYEQIDIILYCLIDKKLSLEDTVKESQIDKEIVEKIHDMYKNSEHKRINPKEL
ncbi:MAG: NAD+ synthase [Thaumarchaeota archaeon]|nr:NAD+ synthase [Nitrososphaerota archaeon]MBT4509414.1 NAD+ synthase [Nitrososphaerota archaeon]MBT4973817.1 NAD+ synthase [Nitrososphaerota archaeon]MBT5993454.1 NAD+ synthase [Nitrososphaerota archaeon]MBT6171743.1 NAD+ synthase [Nitrososphaerota archaeon]